MAKDNNAVSKNAKKPQKERRFHPVRYLKEMWGEVKKLSWLSWKDLAKHTAAVVVFVLIMAVIIWALDFGFSAGVKGLSSLGGVVATDTAEDVADPAAEPQTEDPASEPQE